MGLLHDVPLAGEGMAFSVEPCGGWRCTETCFTLAGGVGAREAEGGQASGRSLSFWEVETETSEYFHSQVTWMRNGPGGHVTGVRASTEESIYYPGRKFVLLDSVAADIMISFPSVEGD